MYMNHEYKFRLMSKQLVRTLKFESADGSIERDIENVFSCFKRVEGGNVSGLYEKTNQTVQIMNELEQKYDDLTQKRIRSLTRFFSDANMAIGDLFIKQMTYADVTDQIRSYNKWYCLKNKLDLHKEDLHFCETWLWLSMRFKTYSYGWSDDDVYIGSAKKGNRHCRFCSNTEDNKFLKRAHAISESLGNKHLFSNEECDDCNAGLAKIEDHFLRLMDIRRSLFKISGKGASSHCVEGRNFVIRPNENNDPIIYLKAEDVPYCDESKPFSIKLKHKWCATNEKIYKALVKYVIDLLPDSELVFFNETIKWINGTVYSGTLPSMRFGVHDRVIKQPIIDIYINDKGYDNTPYCTAVLYSCDIAYMYVIPFCSIDKGMYKQKELIQKHLNMFGKHNYLVKVWTDQNTSEYESCLVWCWWLMEPGKYEIRPTSDPIFNAHELNGVIQKTEIEFPDIRNLGLSLIGIERPFFKVYINGEMKKDEMRDLSGNIEKNELVFDDWHNLSLTFGVKFCDSENKIPLFEFCFTVKFRTMGSMSDYIYGDEREKVMSHALLDLIYDEGLTAGEKVIRLMRQHTCFQHCEVTYFLRPMERRFLKQVSVFLPHKGC